MLDHLLIEFRQTCRALAGRLEWTIGVALVLMIGLTCTGSMFALVDPLLSKPLPYPFPNQLMLLRLSVSPLSSADQRTDWPTFAEWALRDDLFDEVAAYGEVERLRLLAPEGAMALRVRRVTPNLLKLLGASPGTPALWQASLEGTLKSLAVTDRWAAAHAELIGALIADDQGGHVQLMRLRPDGFLFPDARVRMRPDGVIPEAFEALAWRHAGSTGFLTGVVRIHPGVSIAAVHAALSPRLAEYGLRLVIEPLTSHMTGGLRSLAIAALLAGLVVLTLCIANVTNLVVARGIYRTIEFSTRAALGATRADLLRILLIELLVLVGAATTIGMFVSTWTLSLIRLTIPDEYLALGAPSISFRVGLFMMFIGAGIVILCLYPAWISARSALVTNVATRSRRDHTKWLRLALAAGQTALAMIMAVGAALLARSYANLWGQNTGYDPATIVATVSHSPSLSRGPLLAVMDDLTQRLRAVPGIRGVASSISAGSLLDGYSSIGGERLRVGNQIGLLGSTQVSPSYFDVVGTTVLRGRPFVDEDRGRPVAIVNQALAARFWPDRPPESLIGQTLLIDNRPHEVVGLVQNVFDQSLDRLPVPRYYQPLGNAFAPFGRVSYVLRVEPGVQSADAIGRAVAAVDSQAVVESLESIDGRLAEGIRDRTFVTLVLGLFGIAGLGVTAAGIFGIVSFVVARRTREIGIRVALGAPSSHVRWLVMRDALVASLFGATTGFLVARMSASFLESYLYGLEAGDLSTPLAAAVIMGLVTSTAAWWPTRRALRLQPTLALRTE